MKQRSHRNMNEMYGGPCLYAIDFPRAQPDLWLQTRVQAVHRALIGNYKLLLYMLVSVHVLFINYCYTRTYVTGHIHGKS